MAKENIVSKKSLARIEEWKNPDIRKRRINGVLNFYKKHSKKETISCFTCGISFTDYPSLKRKYCSRDCSNSAKKGQKPWNTGKVRKDLLGDKNPNWRGGITPLYQQIRSSVAYKKWRKKVFKRDFFTCVKCNDSSGGNLNADHIKPFAILLKEEEIKTIKEALNNKLLWSLDNGRTLCEECHKKTDSWGFQTLNYLLGRKSKWTQKTL